MVATAGDVRNEGNLPKVSDSVITPHIQKAEVKLRRILGDSVYDDIANLQGSYAQSDKDRLVLAESLFALFYLIPVINTVTSGEGGITREIGFGETTTRYIDHQEAVGIANMYYNRGMAVIDEYIPQATEPEEVTEVVGRDLSIYAV
jgi:hypothetical protein